MLFPVVGALRGTTLTVDERDYAMERHGLARRANFECMSHAPDRCTLAITDTPAARAQYPFGWRRPAPCATGLEVALTASNTGDLVLPCSLGFHPAFNWPLDDGAMED